jgi:hypothetical protein
MAWGPLETKRKKERERKECAFEVENVFFFFIYLCESYANGQRFVTYRSFLCGNYFVYVSVDFLYDVFMYLFGNMIQFLIFQCCLSPFVLCLVRAVVNSHCPRAGR